MNASSIVIVGLPASGKTTFLAALWHLVTARDIATTLSFHKLGEGEVGHLHFIARRWEEARVQERTGIGGNQVVTMHLVGTNGDPIRLDFPDVAGEAYTRMCEDRACEPDLAGHLSAGAVMLFVHGDRIVFPNWLVEESALTDGLGLRKQPDPTVAWTPSSAPTQVQVVDLLQMLAQGPLAVGQRRLAIMLSAWDKARGERKTPRSYLRVKLPLLFQYLSCQEKNWAWRVYGLSAQGGEYDADVEGATRKPAAEALRRLEVPSERILLVDGRACTHDLTLPLAWLMGSSGA